MPRSRVVFALLALLAVCLVMRGDPTAAEPLVEAPWLVVLEDGTTREQADQLCEAAGLDIVEQLNPLPIYRARGPDGVELSDIEHLRAHPLVRAVERDGEQRLSLVPNDALYRPYQWNLRRIGMEQVWDLRPTAPEIVVAVLDSGVDLTHPELRPNILVERGYNFSADTTDPQDDETHGTAIAGIIGAIGNNQDGIAGIAWKVKLLPVKVLNAQGRGSNSTLARAVIFAADRGARIINISSTSEDFSAALARAVEYAQEQGALVVAAAGNSGDGLNELTFPASLPGVLAVGAIDSNDHLAPFSQRRRFVSVVAPGVDIASTAWPGAGRGLQGSYSGTSIAAPHVSGVAALLWTLRPDLTADQLSTLITSSADDLGHRDEVGYGTGALNAARAVASARQGVPPSPFVAPPAGVTPFPIPTPAPAASPEAPRPPEPTRWYFAEGSTNSPFDLWFAIENVGANRATVRFTFALTDGSTQTHEMAIAPNARASLHANEVLPNAEFATTVESSQPVYVERSMYFGHDGHSATGMKDAAKTWYLAEGSSVPPFDTWVLIMNPGDIPTTARLTFMLEGGQTRAHELLVPARSRVSLFVNQLFFASGFSTKVDADQPVVVERAMYFDEGKGGHGTAATTAPAQTWHMAEGTSKSGFDTWLLIQNPGAVPANVEVTFFTDDARRVTHPILVPPNSRTSLLTNLLLADATYGIRAAADQPVVVERAVYFHDGRAGHDSAATPELSREWLLPEGASTGSFVGQLSLMNPGDQPATVDIAAYREDGVLVEPRRLLIRPNQRLTVDLNGLAPDSAMALRVTSSHPIVAERTLYFATPQGLGATNSVGLPR